MAKKWFTISSVPPPVDNMNSGQRKVRVAQHWIFDEREDGQIIVEGSDGKGKRAKKVLVPYVRLDSGE